MKIIELLLDELEDFAGFDAVALVNQPAIEAGFHAFNSDVVHDALALQIIKEAMKDQFVTRIPGESKDDYLGRCIPKLRDEGYPQDQATAICHDTFDLDVTQIPDFQTTGSYDAHEMHFNVTVVKTDDGNKFVINGELTPDLHLVTGNTYCFDQSDESNETHPLRISTTKNGIHDGGEEYTNGVAVMGDKLYLQVTQDTPNELFYFCTNHSGMGGDSKIIINDKDEFDSYTDYPQSATNAAKRALEWRDKNGTECGTRVGWARANQLANKRPISEDTIARMASFKRHQQHKDVPYSEGCGGLMWDAWGGTAGIEWASRKLEEIRMSSLPKDKYFDNLSDTKQEKLLERLEEVGYSKGDLQEDYVITDEPQKFALPSKSSANPNGPTETKGAYKILYKYNGPRDSKTRTFCRRLLDLDLLFRKEDIQKMTLEGANSSEFGYYDIFQYKGSYGCRHNWVKQYVYKKKSTGLLEIAGLLLDQEKQTKKNIRNPQTVQQFSKKFKFATNDEQMRVVGPLMIPDKLILRVDDNNEPYFVYFSEKTIRDIAYKMMKEKKLDEVNLEHDQDTTVEGHLEETWIVEDENNDKQNAFGFDFPKGTWMGQYKIEDPKVWELVKNDTLTGFSIEGYFADRLVQQ